MTDATFYRTDDPDRFIYHYTTRELALTRILVQRRLKVSTFSSTNDPRESKDWEFDLSWRGERGPPNIESHAEMKRTATDRAKRTVKLLCMSSDDGVAVEKDPLDMFARGFARPRVWAQYAENHKGVCLVFVREALHRTIVDQLGAHAEIYHGSVDYSNDESDREGAFSLDRDQIDEVGLASVLSDHIRNFHKHLFFTKAGDWSTEFEYRWVVDSPSVDPEFVSFGDALVAVVVGADFHEVYDASLRPLCKTNGATFARLYWRNGHPDLIPYPETEASQGA